MDVLNDFEEMVVDEHNSKLLVPVRHVEILYNVRYFINDSGVGYCSLLTEKVKGKGLKGKIEVIAAKAYIGRYILVFLSELTDGRRLVTVPALFEKEPTFDNEVELSDLIINTYYHDNLKKTPLEVLEEHMKALEGRSVSNDRELLRKDTLLLPKKGLEILNHIR